MTDDRTERLKQLSAMTALNAMMQSGHFSICTIDEVGKLMGVNPRGDAYDILRPLHCVSWSKMPDELRAEVPTLIKGCLGVGPTYVFKSLDAEVVEIAEPKRGLLRLLGGR